MFGTAVHGSERKPAPGSDRRTALFVSVICAVVPVFGKGKSDPVLAVDIDGVISLFGFDQRSEPGQADPSSAPGEFHLIDGMLHCIALDTGPRLNQLSNLYELVWASGWEDRANDHLPAILGVPELPISPSTEGRALAPPIGSSRHWTSTRARGPWRGSTTASIRAATSGRTSARPQPSWSRPSPTSASSTSMSRPWRAGSRPVFSPPDRE